MSRLARILVTTEGKLAYAASVLAAETESSPVWGDPVFDDFLSGWTCAGMSVRSPTVPGHSTGTEGNWDRDRVGRWPATKRSPTSTYEEGCIARALALLN